MKDYIFAKILLHGLFLLSLQEIFHQLAFPEIDLSLLDMTTKWNLLYNLED